jgi:hypothetical protein
MKLRLRRILNRFRPPGNRLTLAEGHRLKSEDPIAFAAKAYMDGQGGGPGSQS